MTIENTDTTTIVTLEHRLHEFQNSLEVNKGAFTKREKEIILEMANGLTSDEISSKLYISKSTVDTHRKNIYRKGKFRGIRDVVLFSFFL